MFENKALVELEGYVNNQVANPSEKKVGTLKFNVMALGVLAGGKCTSTDSGDIKIVGFKKMMSMKELLKFNTIVARWHEKVLPKMAEKPTVVKEGEVIDPNDLPNKVTPISKLEKNSRKEFTKTIEKVIRRPISISEFGEILEMAIAVRKRQWKVCGIVVGGLAIVITGGILAANMLKDEEPAATDVDADDTDDEVIVVEDDDIDDDDILVYGDDSDDDDEVVVVDDTE
jgi:hypothetical protein